MSARSSSDLGPYDPVVETFVFHRGENIIYVSDVKNIIEKNLYKGYHPIELLLAFANNVTFPSEAAATVRQWAGIRNACGRLAQDIEALYLRCDVPPVCNGDMLSKELSQGIWVIVCQADALKRSSVMEKVDAERGEEWPLGGRSTDRFKEISEAFLELIPLYVDLAIHFPVHPETLHSYSMTVSGPMNGSLSATVIQRSSEGGGPVVSGRMHNERDHASRVAEEAFKEGSTHITQAPDREDEATFGRRTWSRSLGKVWKRLVRQGNTDPTQKMDGEAKSTIEEGRMSSLIQTLAINLVENEFSKTVWTLENQGARTTGSLIDGLQELAECYDPYRKEAAEGSISCPHQEALTKLLGEVSQKIQTIGQERSKAGSTSIGSRD